MEREEVANRIKAARLLRGMSQEELAARVAEAGLPWRLVGALERCELDIAAVHRLVLARELGFPESWFIDGLDEMLALLER